MSAKEKGDTMKDEIKGDKMDASAKEVEIMPLKDFVLHCPPHVVKKELVKGQGATVPAAFISSLKSEKVI